MYSPPLQRTNSSYRGARPTVWEPLAKLCRSCRSAIICGRWVAYSGDARSRPSSRIMLIFKSKDLTHFQWICSWRYSRSCLINRSIIAVGLTCFGYPELRQQQSSERWSIDHDKNVWRRRYDVQLDNYKPPPLSFSGHCVLFLWILVYTESVTSL
jgi:hypothetical protein